MVIGSSKALGCHLTLQELGLPAMTKKDHQSASTRVAIARIPRQLWAKKFGVVCLLYATFAA
jgi:hypothetical protein